MDAQAWSAVGAVLAGVAALAALWYAARAANAAREQTKIQRQLALDAAQPYVWVDIRPSDDEPFIIVLVLGNSGPTVATNIRLTFAPPLTPSGFIDKDLIARLSRSFTSLPPGRTMSWEFGSANQLLAARGPRHDVSIEADGPFGPLKALTYTIDFEAFRGTRAKRIGSLQDVAASVKKLGDPDRLGTPT